MKCLGVLMVLRADWEANKAAKEVLLIHAVQSLLDNNCFIFHSDYGKKGVTLTND